MIPSESLRGRKALITGAGRGIGRATAVLFAHEGADLALTARTQDELDASARDCRALGAEVLAAPCDLADTEQVSSFFDDAARRLGRFDILINNAAAFDRAQMTNVSLERMDRSLSVNFRAPLLLSQRFLAGCEPGRPATIVNVSSFSGCFGVEKFPGFGLYNISKYALWGLTEILALECRPLGVRVNQISPSGVDTAMFRQAAPPGVPPDLSPEEVAEQILYLASEASYPMSGENIMLRGMPAFRPPDSEQADAPG